MSPTGRYIKLEDGTFEPEKPLHGTPICSFFTGGHMGGEGRANARLIAAAPDLANAALLALDFILYRQGNDAAETVVVADLRAALAKARGDVA